MVLFLPILTRRTIFPLLTVRTGYHCALLSLTRRGFLATRVGLRQEWPELPFCLEGWICSLCAQYPEVIVLDGVCEPPDYNVVSVQDASDPPGGCVNADDHPAILWYLESEGPFYGAFLSGEKIALAI
jgi:hypothetical protein